MLYGYFTSSVWCVYFGQVKHALQHDMIELEKRGDQLDDLERKSGTFQKKNSSGHRQYM